MVSRKTVLTYPFHHAKLQILQHGVTANSLYLSFSPCKATNLTTWCHCKQSSFSPCKATNLTTWCHRKQSLLILFTMQSYKSYYMVSPQTVFTYPFHHAKLQILQHGVTANSLYLSFSPCKATNLTTWCHRKQSLLILFTMQSYTYYISNIINFSIQCCLYMFPASASYGWEGGKAQTLAITIGQSESVQTRIPIFVCFGGSLVNTPRMALDLYTRNCFSESMGSRFGSPEKKGTASNERVHSFVDFCLIPLSKTCSFDVPAKNL